MGAAGRLVKGKILLTSACGGRTITSVSTAASSDWRLMKVARSSRHSLLYSAP